MNDEIIDKKKLFFKKFKIISFISKGNFGNVYLGKNIRDNKLVAIKIENRFKHKNKALEKEAYFLYNLKGYGIPEIISYGYSGNYNILIETLLGKSLYDLRIKNKFTLKDICMVAIQIINRLTFIHSKYIIHCDIKPQNFLVGYSNPSIIYICDFGISQKYRSSISGKHIKMTRSNKKIYVTLFYSSVNSLFGYQQSRRDDLESLGYLLLHLNKDLPWEKIKFTNMDEYRNKILALKKNINLLKLCQDLPIEFYYYMKYVKELKFEEKPNYAYLKDLFYKVLYKLNTTNDYIFSWTENIPKKSVSKNDFAKLSSRSSRSNRSVSPKLCNKIISKRNCSEKKSDYSGITNFHKTQLSVNNLDYFNKENDELEEDIDLHVEHNFYIDFNRKNKFL